MNGRLLCLFILVLLCIHNVSPVTLDWLGTSSGSMANKLNYVVSGAPAAAAPASGDIIQIGVISNQIITAPNFDLAGGVKADIRMSSNTLNINSDALINNVQQSSSSTVSVLNADFKKCAGCAGTYSILSGTLSITANTGSLSSNMVHTWTAGNINVAVSTGNSVTFSDTTTVAGATLTLTGSGTLNLQKYAPGTSNPAININGGTASIAFDTGSTSLKFSSLSILGTLIVPSITLTGSVSVNGLIKTASSSPVTVVTAGGSQIITLTTPNTISFDFPLSSNPGPIFSLPATSKVTLNLSGTIRATATTATSIDMLECTQVTSTADWTINSLNVGTSNNLDCPITFNGKTVINSGATINQYSPFTINSIFTNNGPWNCYSNVQVTNLATFSSPGTIAASPGCTLTIASTSSFGSITGNANINLNAGAISYASIELSSGTLTWTGATLAGSNNPITVKNTGTQFTQNSNSARELNHPVSITLGAFFNQTGSGNLRIRTGFTSSNSVVSFKSLLHDSGTFSISKTTLEFWEDATLSSTTNIFQQTTATVYKNLVLSGTPTITGSTLRLSTTNSRLTVSTNLQIMTSSTVQIGVTSAPTTTANGLVMNSGSTINILSSNMNVLASTVTLFGLSLTGTSSVPTTVTIFDGSVASVSATISIGVYSTFTFRSAFQWGSNGKFIVANTGKLILSKNGNANSNNPGNGNSIDLSGVLEISNSCTFTTGASTASGIILQSSGTISMNGGDLELNHALTINDNQLITPTSSFSSIYVLNSQSRLTINGDADLTKVTIVANDDLFRVTSAILSLSDSSLDTETTNFVDSQVIIKGSGLTTFFVRGDSTTDKFNFDSTSSLKVTQSSKLTVQIPVYFSSESQITVDTGSTITLKEVLQYNTPITSPIILSIDDSTLTLDHTSETSNLTSTATVSDSTLNLKEGTLSFHDGSTVTISGSTINLDDGNLVIEPGATLYLKTSTFDLVNRGRSSGRIIINGGGTIVIDGNMQNYLNEKYITLQNGANVRVSGGTQLTAGSSSPFTNPNCVSYDYDALSSSQGILVESLGTLEISLDGCVIMNKDAPIVANDNANITIADNGRLTTHETSVTAGNGVFVTNGVSQVTFDRTTGQVQGTTSLYGDFVNLVASTFSFDTLNVGNSTAVTLDSSSSLTVTLGHNLNILANGNIASTGGQLTVNSDLTMSGFGSISLSSSSNGKLSKSSLSGNSFLNVDFSRLDTGELNLGANSHLDLHHTSQMKTTGPLSLKGSSTYVIVDGGSTLSVSGSLSLTTSILTLTEPNSIVNVDTALSLSSSIVTIDNNAKLNVSNDLLRTQFNMDGTSKLTVSGTGKLSTSNTAFSLNNSANLTLDGSSITLTSTDITSLLTSSINLANSATFALSSGSYSASNDSKFFVSNSDISLSGVITLADRAKIIVDMGSASISQTQLKDNSEINVSDGNLSITSSSAVDIGDFSKILLSSTSSFTANGPFTAKKNSTFSLDTSTATIDANTVFIDGAQLLGIDATVNINGGLSLSDYTSITFTDSNTYVQNSNFAIDGNCIADFVNSPISLNAGQLSFKGFSQSNIGNSDITIPTGTVSFMDNSISTIRASEFTLTGDADVSSSALVQFLGNAKITVSGSFSLSGNSNTELQTSELDISNSLVATSNATLKLSSTSSVNLTSSNSIVSFDGTCKLILLSQSHFILTDGSTTFDGYSAFTIDGGSIVDISGLLEFLDHSNLTPTSSIINIAGNFNAQDNTIISSTSSSFNIVNRGTITLKGSTYLSLLTSPMVVNGTANLREHTIIDTSSSNFEVRGNLTSNDFSTMNLYSSTLNVIGRLNAYNDSALKFSASNFILSGTGDFYDHSSLSLLDNLCTFTVTGNLTFHDSAILSIAGGNTLNIDNGAFTLTGSVRTIWEDLEINIRGSLALKEDAYLSATNCKITVFGAITTEDNISFLIDSTNITVNGLAGKGIFFGGTQTSDHQFLNSNIDIASGALYFSGYVSPIFDHSTLTLLSGDVQFKEHSSPNFISQSSVSVGGGSQPVVFRDFSVPSFSDSKFSVIGEAIFQDSSIATFQSSIVNVTGNLFFQNGVRTYFYDTQVTVDSSSGGVEFKDSVHSVNDGGFFQLNNGYLKLENDVQITFNKYLLTVNYGDVSFTDDSYIQFLDSTSTIIVNSGNFDLFDNSKLITFPDSTISINGGDFTINDIVSLNFDAVTVNVGGNVEFHDSSKITSTGSDYIINNGFFSLYESSSFIASSGTSVSITLGDFNVVDDSSFLITNSHVNVYSGNFATKDSIKFISTSSQISVLGSAIFDGLLQSTHTFTQTSVDVNQGNIIFKGYIDPTIQASSSFTVNDGMVVFKEHVVSAISDSSIDVKGGSVFFQGNSNSSFHSSTITVDSSSATGTVSINESSIFNLDQNSFVTVKGGDFLTNDDVTFSAANSHFTISGNVIFAGNLISQHNFQNSDMSVTGTVSITDHVDPQFVTSLLSVSGTVTIQDFTNTQFTQLSNITISGGNLIINDHAIVTVVQSPISISSSGGLLSLANSAQFTVTDTSISVQGGDLKTFDDIKFIVTNSDITVAGSITFSGTIDSTHSFTSVRVIVNNGNINFTEYIDPSFASSSLNVNQGFVYIEDHTISTFSSTSISIDKGSLFIKDNSRTTYTSQTITIDTTGGLLAVSESAYFSIDQSTINVNGGDFKTFNDVTLIVRNSQINVVGSITFAGLLSSTHSFTQVQVSVNNGDISITEFVDPTFADSSLTLNQGLVTIKDSTITAFSSTPISITKGSLLIEDQSSTTYTSSEITIDAAGGLLSVSDDSHFSVSHSKITVSGGKVQTQDNISFIVSDTDITVSGSVYLSGQMTSAHEFTSVKMVVTGNVNFTQAIDPHFTTSSLDVNEGSFTIDGTVQSSFSNTPITVNGGSILITDHSHSQLTDSRVKIRNGANLGGDLHIADNSVISFLRSPIFVEGGDIYISDSADAYITDSTSTININVGNFILSETADLFTVPNTVINVNVGNFKVLNFVDLLFNKVTLNVAGTVEFHDDSKLSALANTLISVVDGFFTTNDSTSISITDSKILLNKLASGGNILLQDSTKFSAKTSTIQIDSGSFIISQNTNFNTQSTDVKVNDGQFMTQDEVQYSMTSSTLFVQGDVTLSGLVTSAHSFSQTSINVATGNLLFTQDIDPNLVSSSILVTDGLITVEQNVRATLTDTDTVIYGGSLLIKDNSNSLFTRSDILIDLSSSSQKTGFLSISNNSQFKISDSNIKVYGGDLKTFDHVDFEATATSIEVVGNVRFSGFVDSTHKFDQVTVSVNSGNILFTQDIDPTFYRSNLTVNLGVITIEANVLSNFLQSNFSVFGGNLNILESSNNTFSYVNILVDGGAKKRSEIGAITITDDSIFSIDHSSIVVRSGTIQTFKNIQFYARSTSIKVFGSVFFSGLATSKYTFDDVPITVETGQMKLSISMQPIFSYSSINVTGGSFTIEDSVNSTFLSTPILVDGGNFYFYNQTTTYAHNSSITVQSSGGVMLIESTSKLSIVDSSVTVTGGNLQTSDTIELKSNNSPILVNGNVKFSGVKDSVHDFFLSPMSVINGYVLFTQDVDPVFTLSPIEISSGTFTIEKNTLANLFTSYVVIYNGQFYAKDHSTTNFQNSSLTVASTSGGLLSFTEYSTLTFEESPILMRGGDIIGRDYSDFYIKDPTTTLTIQSGNFFLYDHADFFTVQQTRISVVRGNFKVFDFVAIDFDQLHLSVFGLFEIFDDSYLNFLDSDIQIYEGTYTANTNSNMVITTSEMSVIDGSFLTYDDCVFESYNSLVNISKDAKSKKAIKGGIFSGYDHSTLIFGDSSLSVDGFFSNFDHSNFTCEATEIVVISGDFLTADYSTFSAFSSQLSINNGYFIVRNYASFDSEDSSINITGSFVNEDNIRFLLSRSSISVFDGTFSTTDNIDFTSLDSSIHVEGNVLLGGTSLSSHSFQNTILDIVTGNLTFLNYVTPSVVSTNVTISGGFYEALEYSHITFSQTFLSLEGVGTLIMLDHSYWALKDSSLAQVVSDGATAIFCDYSIFEVFSDSTFNITNGNITFCGRSKLNLYPNTNFNLLDGSFTLSGKSVMVAYQNTSGIINGGNMYVIDDATLIFVQSNLVVKGAINHSSSVPIQILDSTSIIVNGSPITVSGNGVISISTGAILEVLDNSLILNNNATVLSNNGTIIVQGGSILANDQSSIIASNETSITVTAGNITTAGESTFSASSETTITISATADSIGQLFVTQQSTFSMNSALLNVNNGNIFVSQDGVLSAENETTITVSGNITFLDTSYLTSDSSNINVISGGNLIASGVGVQLDFSNSIVNVIGGDIISTIRSEIYATDSTFTISEGGSLSLTDLTFTQFTHNSAVIVEGGDLLLSRQSILSITDHSSINVTKGGSVIYHELSKLYLSTYASLNVVNGGSISFYDNSTLVAEDHSSAFVEGGGNIDIHNYARVLLSSSSLTVLSGGGIQFFDNTKTSLDSDSLLFVEGGGDVTFSDATSLECASSTIKVSGGNVIFSGTGGVNFFESSTLEVQSGNVEYYLSKTISFSASYMNILGGNLISTDDSQFAFTSSSVATISGGFFRLQINSQLTVDSSSIIIENGGVSLENNSKATISAGNIEITNSVSGTGNFNIQDSVDVILEKSSLLSVSGGNFVLSSEATLSSEDSGITVSAGSALFYDDVQYSGIRSSVVVSSGNSVYGTLEIYGNSIWGFYENSLAKVESGSLLIYGSTTVSTDLSQFVVTNGDCLVYGSSSFTMNKSSLSVTGGNLQYSEQTIFTSKLSDITVRGGQVIYDNNANIVMQQTNLVVYKNLDRATGLNDLIIIRGDSKFEASQNSVIQASLGNLVFAGKANSAITNSAIIVDGGNMKQTSNSFSTITSTTAEISAGSFEVLENSQIIIQSQSNFKIIGGNFNIFNNPIFKMIESSITVSAGIVHFTGGSIYFTASNVLVNENGSMLFAGNSFVNFVSSNITLDGKGIFTISDQTKVYVSFSSIKIQSGSFSSLGSSQLFISDSIYSITGGNTVYGGYSSINVQRSTFTISGGDVSFTDNSAVSISADSTYSVTGGNVITSGSTLLSLTDSCFNLTQGVVSYSGSSSVNLVNSCWNISGGNAYFTDDSTYSLSSNSRLNLVIGSIEASDSASISVSQSFISILGGSYTLGGSAEFKLVNSFVSIFAGAANWKDNSNSFISNSSFSVSGGVVNFSGSSHSTWTSSSTLTVIKGDILMLDRSTTEFSDSTISILSGSLQFHDFSQSTFNNVELLIKIGSVNFIDNSVCYFKNVDITIPNGNLQYTDNSNVVFDSTTVTIKNGMLELLNEAEVVFVDSTITLAGGSISAQNQVNVNITNCDMSIVGTLYAQNKADLGIFSSSIEINGGDIQLLDEGSFSMFDSSIDIRSGNLIVNNPEESTRKEVTFSFSKVNVQRNAAEVSSGNFNIEGNVDVTLLGSNFTIDGNLQMFSNAKLNVFRQSNFNIPSGVVTMDQFSSIEISEDSAFLNQGTLFAPGQIGFPSGSSVQNSGFMHSDHALSVNCDSESSPFHNSGTLSISASGKRSCLGNVNHTGFMQISGGNITLGTFTNTRGSTVTLTDSVVSFSGSVLYSSAGSFGGSGRIEGNFENKPGAVLMGTGDAGTTNLYVTNDFTSSGTMFFMINSRDLAEPNAITAVNAGLGVQLNGGRACICFSPTLELVYGDKWDLVNAATLLDGTFDTVEFGCVECPSRAARSVQSTEQTCEPTTDYSSRSFSVLFESCDGGSGSNFLTSITPPYYVIIPVAVGIILILVVVFGGALFIDERVRKYKFQKKAKSKRSNRIKEMRNAGSSSKGSSSRSESSQLI